MWCNAAMLFGQKKHQTYMRTIICWSVPTSLDIITMLKAEVHKEKQSLNPFSDSFDADKLRKMLTNKVGN